MDWTAFITAIGGVIIALGGFESVKWLFNRKTGKRVEEAKADSSEFDVLAKTTVFLQEQVAELTAEVRNLNKENIELTSQVTMLKTERSLKLCERRGCADRQPQSLY